MGSNSFLKPKSVYRAKSGSSAGSEKEMNGKLKRSKIRRPVKMNEYGLKRVPDYTELAYKEAVSKLRYFLSGNSAPSVRSYGGSASIKNLEESDGDLDKKYSTSFNTLSEYKPRPRLTAKYATLYADSLNNYNPPAPTVTSTAPPQAPTADLSGGTNPDVINFIQKQEEYIEQLERESQYCREELNNLLGKVKEVISENEHLHEAQKNKLISRMFHSYNAGSETDELDDVGDSTGLDSDNKMSPSKTRRAAKSRSVKLEGPNIVFESRIAELEAQLTQAKIDLKKVQEENNENKRKLANGLVDSTCLDGFKRQIDNLQRDKSALESQIVKLKLNLEQKEGDTDGKYKRGSDAVENQLREERNNLEMEIRRLKDDLAKERSKVRELAGEGARRAIQERSAAEQRYNAHFDELQHDLAAQYDNVSKLQLDLERQRREENDLKRELSMKNAAVEELKMELKNKTASLQADLAQAYAEKASLEEELASARLAIERNQRQAKHEANRLNSEIQSLRQRLDRADADLVHSRRENLRLSEQISNLEKELNMKSLTPISPEKNKKEKELSTMLESMENKHAKTVAELESMIQSQNSLMEKLTSECRLLTDKLDDANRRHKIEKAQLLCRNSELMRKLRNLWSSHKKYCTTTIAPYRSYTPLSGYPSSSSYDLDRTYMTSTPYTYRNRFRGTDGSSYIGNARDEIGHLSKHLSDLSIDRIGDSDDDAIKEHRKELATLQRQVEYLGQSLQSIYSHPPSNNQAHSSHTAETSRVSHSQPDTGPDYTGTESTGDTAFRENNDMHGNIFNDHETAGDINEEHIEEQTNDDNQNYNVETSNGLSNSNEQAYYQKEIDTNNIENTSSEKSSRDSVNREGKTLKKQLSNEHGTPEHTKTEIDDTKIQESHVTKDNDECNTAVEKIEPVEEKLEDLKNSEHYTEQDDYVTEESKPVEEQNMPHYENQPYTDENYQNYEQSYEQNYEQPQYTEQYENYEQYPQQYTDPNAQYEGQYENYVADEKYNEQNYDKTQYGQDYAPQYTDDIPQQPTDSDDVQTNQMSEDSPSDTLKEKVASQS